jgi:hypothetical protein
VLRRFLRRALPVVAAAVFVAATSVAGAPGAAAAAVPGWRIVTVLPLIDLGGLTVLSARDAWVAGDSCADAGCDRDTVIVRHWDGTAWRAIAVPKTATGMSDDSRVGAEAASSGSNAWVFINRGDSVVDTTALRWTGKGWAPAVRLAADLDVAVAPSARDAWAFGAAASNPWAGYVAHFNGTTWSHASFPFAVDDASAPSAGDIWASGVAGDVTHESAAIEHWNGKAWRRVPLPRLGIPSDAWLGVSVTALTARDVWAEVGAFHGDTETGYLLHWNGKGWARLTVSCPGGAAGGAFAPDGHGGVWIAPEGSLASAGTGWLCHDVNGHWTKTAVPTRAGEQPGIDNLAWIPGTRSMWATGGFDADAGEAILTDGPRAA